MKTFLKNIVLFFVLAILIGEVVVRLTHAVVDIPQRTIDENGIQKYFPNQEGFWKGGNHKWVINEMGWAGELPKSYDKLVMVIGDSFIENFMNPEECHQSIFLKSHMPNNNFLEAARAGVSFLEAMEIDRQIDSLKPDHTLIYLNDKDFYESVYDIEPLGDIMQVNLNTKKINYGILKAPRIKKVLYNWKLLYYFYNRFPLNQNTNKQIKDKKKDIEKYELKIKEKAFQLVDYVIENYEIKNKTLVFHPHSNKEIIEKCKSSGFNVIALDSSKDSTWTFEHDSHWTCYGHKKAAEQVFKELKKYISN